MVRLLDDVEGAGGVWMFALVRVDHQRHPPVRLLQHGCRRLRGGYAEDVVRILGRVRVRGEGLVRGGDLCVHPGELNLLDDFRRSRPDGFGRPLRRFQRGGVEHRLGRDHRPEHALARARVGAGRLVVRVGTERRADVHGVDNLRFPLCRFHPEGICDTRDVGGSRRRSFPPRSLPAALPGLFVSRADVLLGAEERVGLLARHRASLEVSVVVASVRLCERFCRFSRLGSRLWGSPRGPRAFKRRQLRRCHVEDHRQPHGRARRVLR